MLALFLGSTPKAFGVVAGSPAGNMLAQYNAGVMPFPGLGKLPRPTGWQPVLPR
ncbi:MAG TPA: hypothetical protein VGM66_03550 [Candidatus Udaeobacter sp.]|jgi:hypothetical protein